MTTIAEMKERLREQIASFERRLAFLKSGHYSCYERVDGRDVDRLPEEIAFTERAIEGLKEALVIADKD